MGSYTVAGPDGVDVLRSVEKLDFDNRVAYIEDAAGLNDVVHRFYNNKTGVHFYTSSNEEANVVREKYPQFEHEGLGFREVVGTSLLGGSVSYPFGTVDVFRFYNEKTETHFYTSSVVERDYVIRNYREYDYEGVAYRAYGTDFGPQEELYRFYNSSTGAHFYTTDEFERDSVIKTFPQFSYEGVAYYVLA